MDRGQKTEAVVALNAVFKQAGVVVVTRNLGLTVAQSTALRTKMRDEGASFKVSKNRLAKLALEGTDYAPIAEMLTGPVALATSDDPVAAAKIAVEFAKTNDNLKIIGGVVNDKVLDVSSIQQLAKLPSLDVLRGKIVGILQAPAANLARVVQAPAGALARVIQAYADKN